MFEGAHWPRALRGMVAAVSDLVPLRSAPRAARLWAVPVVHAGGAEPPPEGRPRIYLAPLDSRLDERVLLASLAHAGMRAPRWIPATRGGVEARDLAKSFLAGEPALLPLSPRRSGTDRLARLLAFAQQAGAEVDLVPGRAALGPDPARALAVEPALRQPLRPARLDPLSAAVPARPRARGGRRAGHAHRARGRAAHARRPARARRLRARAGGEGALARAAPGVRRPLQGAAPARRADHRRAELPGPRRRGRRDARADPRRVARARRARAARAAARVTTCTRWRSSGASRAGCTRSRIRARSTSTRASSTSCASSAGARRSSSSRRTRATSTTCRCTRSWPSRASRRRTRPRASTWRSSR